MQAKPQQLTPDHHRTPNIEHDGVRVSLFPFEDAGWLIDQVRPEMFMFASDYPPPEGGRDPAGRFDGTLDSASTSQQYRDASYFRYYASSMQIQI
ncbi:MAG: hypothetical protein ACI9ON_001348 [Limisphaerales bacterium]|jgi:hypothetical protein